MSYTNLKSYQQAVIIHDITFNFCNKYIEKTSRTKDQMEQAARSGKQNIVEGSSNRTSEKNELKLIGVARASFQELLEDYKDFLRQRNLKLWNKDDAQAKEIRNLSYQPNRTYSTYQVYLENPEIAANVAICLIHQVNYLLDQQIKSLEKEFVQGGGYNEKLRWQREEEKKKQLINSFWRKHQ